jgi:hypothetical protein
MDVGKILGEAWRIYVRDIVVLVIATLVAGLLTIVTIGILAGAMFAGLYLMVIERIRDGKAPQVGDVFGCMDRWLQLFGTILALVILVAIGFLFFIVPGVYLIVIWAFVIPLMAEKRLTFAEARAASKKLVDDAGFWTVFVVLLVLAIVESVASSVIGYVLNPFHLLPIGGLVNLLTTPFTIIGTTVVYFRLDGRGGMVERSVAR